MQAEPSKNLHSFHTSLDVLLDMGEYETAAHLVKTLGIFWESDGYLVDGTHYVSVILDAPESNNLSPALLAALNMIGGNLIRHQSQYQTAGAYYQTGIVQLESNADYEVKTRILSGLGEIAFRRGNYVAAMDYYRQHLEVSQQAGDAFKIADAFNGLGRMATVQHDWAGALEYHDYGEYLCRQNDYHLGLGWSLNARGELERAQKNYRQAATYFQESIALFEVAHNPGAYRLAAQNWAFALLALGDVKAAETLFTDALAFWKKGGAQHGMSLCLIGFADVALAKRDSTKAARQRPAAARLIGDIGVQLELGDHHDYERTMSKLYEVLPEDAYLEIAERAQSLSLNEFFAQTLPKSNLQSAHALTAREIEILRFVAAGLTDKQIAAHLTISAHTVNAHLRTIYRKLDVNTRTAAVHAAQESSLL
ncbi:MAG: LuxR family transcriptional regulator [Chloroflexota bacterium]